VWDVLSNQEVVDVVGSCSDRSFAARCIVDLANQSWKFKYPTSKTDDCAAVCLFLNSYADGLSGSAVTRKGAGSSKKVIPEDADEGSDSNISGDERSLESFTRLNTLLTLPKFGDISPTKK
jgi:serine/threonine protein phosphatase PrpC